MIDEEMKKHNKTMHEYCENFCKDQLHDEDNYQQNERAIGILHGLWIGTRAYDCDPEVSKMIDRYSDVAKAKRDELRREIDDRRAR